MNSDRIKAGGMLEYERLALIGVLSAPDRPGLAARIFRALAGKALNVQFIVQSIDLHNESHVQFCVANEDYEQVFAIIRPVANELGARKVVATREVSLICVFGPDFRERPGIAGAAFSALASADVNILAVSTSISTVSCVVRSQDHAAAIASLKEVFALP